jgi:hypothetical protein
MPLLPPDENRKIRELALRNLNAIALHVSIFPLVDVLFLGRSRRPAAGADDMQGKKQLRRGVSVKENKEWA